MNDQGDNEGTTGSVVAMEEVYVYHTEPLLNTREERFNIDFLEGCLHAIEYPSPYVTLPYWVELAGEMPLEEAVERWELVNTQLHGRTPELTDELRCAWLVLSKMIVSMHAMALRTWLATRLDDDQRLQRLTFLKGDEWMEYNTACYFKRLGKERLEVKVREFCSTGLFGLYLKTISECYDLLRHNSLYP